MKLQLENVSVSLKGLPIVQNINLTVEAGSFVSLLGASGCGKTTLLKSIAGLLQTESGEIFLNGKNITGLPAAKRGTVIIFQDLRLFPHMTVEKNIAFPLQVLHTGKKEMQEMISRLLCDVQLEGFEKRKIRELSGGQQQRVAIARALAAQPKVLLLDEPFSGLDEKLRLDMGALVKRLQKEHSVTMILVTHDKTEALRLSDTIALMEAGSIIQKGAPQELFYTPVSKAVANYFGKTNYLRGTVHKGSFSSPYLSIPCTMPDGTYDLMIRPYTVKLCREGATPFTITDMVFTGETIECVLSAADTTITAEISAEWMAAEHFTQGEKVGITVNSPHFCFYPVPEL